MLRCTQHACARCCNESVVVAAAAMAVGAAAVCDTDECDGCYCVGEGEIERVEHVAEDARQAHDSGR
jgi:hypothetical protein